ncbi:MAG: DNA repair protein RadC [Armatimonadota bacterium]|nr:DNA repair protein RadC [Armatimonadota bacterium]MDR7445109.1 DNA repair protein RadC [Armatimonadota bacterium]MDR7570616.1 DNA repair protein RadC [Armatimonadota bacterium]MDR7614009.1 DNA repair protein RadC [Armatimonadota bacterium]
MAGLRALPPEARPRERLQSEGPEGISVRELLALVLRTGTRGVSALQLADRLLARFGGLRELGQARVEELTAVEGMGIAKAAVLVAALELGRRARLVDPSERPVIRCAQDAARVVRTKLEGREQEHFCVLLLNTRHEVVGVVEAARGGLNAASVCAREVFREAVRRGAHAVILAHNHPSGNPEPSPEDVRLTERLREAGALLGIAVLDHLVLGDGRFTSLRERGLGF